METDKELFEVLQQRRTVGRLREKFESVHAEVPNQSPRSTRRSQAAAQRHNQARSAFAVPTLTPAEEDEDEVYGHIGQCHSRPAVSASDAEAYSHLDQCHTKPPVSASDAEVYGQLGQCRSGPDSLGTAEDDEYGRLGDYHSGAANQSSRQQQRYSHVSKTVNFFETTFGSDPSVVHTEAHRTEIYSPDEPVKLRPAPPSSHNSSRPLTGPAPLRNVEVKTTTVTSSSRNGRSSSRTTTTTTTTTVLRRPATTVAAPAARANDQVRLRHAPPSEDQVEYDNPAAAEEDGEERIVLRMKEEERAFDRRTRYQSVFKDLPLYQTYSKDVIRRESYRARQGRILDSDLFEELDIPAIDESPAPSVSSSAEGALGAADHDAGRVPDRPASVFEEPESASDSEPTDREPLTRKLAGSGPQRTTWAEMDEVKQSGVLKNIGEHERQLAELLFEVITSEASYFRSLEILVGQFYKAPEFDPSSSDAVLTALQKVHLFSNILRIAEMSENFLTDLEAEWQRSPTDLNNVTRIMHEHAMRHFSDYVPYIRNQIFMNKAFAQLDTDERFKEVVRRIQSQAEVGHIWDFRSFILLPMQRVTRLKLLVDNILRVMTKGGVADSDPRYQQALRALDALMKVLADAETQQDMMTQKERLVTLSNQLDWSTVKAVSISNKTLVKEGKLRLLSAEKWLKRRGFFSSKPLFVYLFLFNDLLIVAKIKNTTNRYVVIDHSPRAALAAHPISVSDGSAKFPFELQLLENHCKSSERFRLDVETATERERWLTALCPSQMRDNSGERVYDEWDCPQVLVTRNYNSRQPDELNLKEGELYSVEKKTPDDASPRREDEGLVSGHGDDGEVGLVPSQPHGGGGERSRSVPTPS